jgi:hypothetical protein
MKKTRFNLILVERKNVEKDMVDGTVFLRHFAFRSKSGESDRAVVAAFLNIIVKSCSYWKYIES